MLSRTGRIFTALLLFFILFAAPSGGQDIVLEKKPASERCCTKEVEIIKTLINRPEIYRSEIFVSVDKSPSGKRSINAFTYGCARREDGSYYSCEFSVTEKLLVSFSKDEFMAVLAREFGHRIDPNLNSGGNYSLESEYYADDFSLKILGRLGIDRGVLLRTLKKLSRGILVATPEEISGFRKRILRLERLLAAEKAK
ncbi:MAG: hypothetical protein Q8P49_02065 [Candidatus Liptonbacteria bacterium]|nr:hypothetical protein [Candidatus Liptonbacteria bacterium]